MDKSENKLYFYATRLRNLKPTEFFEFCNCLLDSAKGSDEIKITQFRRSTINNRTIQIVQFESTIPPRIVLDCNFTTEEFDNDEDCGQIYWFCSTDNRATIETPDCGWALSWNQIVELFNKQSDDNTENPIIM